ncbi:MAG TPA: universal stress protein, partial [Desulfobulbaceae bacterium]|nr:universal stress protein [Desulfobulbaceae bacterium]
VAGREFIEIINAVLRNNHDLVIKTARGMGGKVGMLLGSTAMHLLRKCPCPVWIIKPKQRQHYGRIMAAVDVVPPEVEDDDLNNKIMELATSLATTEKSELHIVHAWEKPAENFLTGGLNYFPGDVKSLINETKNMHIRWLDDFLEQYDLRALQHHGHVLQGWADDVIPEFAERNQIDLIVMGTVCRTGIPGFLIGNTAEKILHRIDCSILAVKPSGFSSPVQLDDK